MQITNMNHSTLNIFDQLAKAEQMALSATFEKRHLTIAECGNVMKATISSLRDRGWRTHEPIWNAALFLNTVAYDLSIGIVDLIYERDVWKRRYIARSLALLLFEIGEDIPAVFGRRFREVSTALGVSDIELNAIGAETKSFSVFWNQHRTTLKEIRTIAAAHRDHDAITLLEAIDNIDLFGLLRLGVELGSMTNTLGAATQRVLNLTSQVAPPELGTKA